MHDKQHPDPFSQLRKKAEARLVQIPPVKAARTAEELLYELQVHQIELEIQNESLREAKIALEDSRDRYLDLYESAPVAYLTIDLSGRISEINLTGAILLAENRGKICQSEFERFVMPSYQGLWRQQFRQALKGDGQQTYELKMRRSNGASFDGHLYCSRVIVSDASPELRIALADITNQKTADAARRLLEPRLHQLTRRERDVLALALSGMPNKEISVRLRINQRTVENHRSRIHQKTGVTSLLELAQKTATAGITLAEIAIASNPVPEQP